MYALYVIRGGGGSCGAHDLFVFILVREFRVSMREFRVLKPSVFFQLRVVAFFHFCDCYVVLLLSSHY